jgi:hypothetical protein
MPEAYQQRRLAEHLGFAQKHLHCCHWVRDEKPPWGMKMKKEKEKEKRKKKKKRQKRNISRKEKK